MPFVIPLITTAAGAIAGFFGGLFTGDAAKNLAHVLALVAVAAIVIFFIYKKTVA